MREYYSQRASAGLIISEATSVTPMGVGYAATPDLPRRFALRAPLNEWRAEKFYSGAAEGYVDYPRLAAAG